MENMKNKLEKIYLAVRQKGLIKAHAAIYSCPYCKDTGQIMYEDLEGCRYVRPCQCLAKRKVELRLQKSGISKADYARYRLENFCTDTEDGQMLYNLAQRYLKYRQRGEGVAIVGKSGTGKTHICIALCQALTQRYGEQHYYFSYRAEIQKIKAAMYKEGEYAQLMAHWRAVPNLYIDDLFKGASTAPDGLSLQLQDRQIVYDLINARLMAQRATFFSSEYSLSEIIRADEAIGGRICQMAKNYLYKTKGENWRLRSAR